MNCQIPMIFACLLGLTIPCLNAQNILSKTLPVARETPSSPPKARHFTPNPQWAETDLSEVKVRQGSALDLSCFLAPEEAGAYGKATVATDGSLQFERQPGKKVKLYGFMGDWWTIQPLLTYDAKGRTLRETIAEFAVQMKRHGYNFFRFHGLMDRFYTNRGNSGIPTAEHLDLLDLMASELKKNGIYVLVDIAAYGLRFGPEVPPNLFLKAGTMIRAPHYWTAWKSCAQQILNHVNPYTGMTWKDDPAVICINYFNEQATGVKLATQNYWDRMPEDIKNLYLKHWRKWMTKTYGSPQQARKLGSTNLQDKPDFTSLDIPSIYGNDPLGQDFHAFLTELFTAEVRDFNDFTKAIGYHGLATQYNSCVDLGTSAARWQTATIISHNSHWGHPSNSTHRGSRVSNRSSLEATAEGTAFCYGNRTRFIDRPMMLTEFSHAFWNAERYESGMLTPAYAALNGYAGIIHGNAIDLKAEGKWPRGRLTNFRVSTSPIAIASSVLGFFLFQRNDVSEARHAVEAVYTNDFLKKYSRLTTSTLQNRIGLMTKFGIRFASLPRPLQLKSTVTSDIQLPPDTGAKVKDGLWFSTSDSTTTSTFNLNAFVDTLKEQGILPPENISNPAKGIYQSETGEITLYGNHKIMEVITPMTEAFVIPNGQRRTLTCLAAEATTAGCVSISSLDGKALPDSRHILLLYITKEANTGMELSPDGKEMITLGEYPVLLRTGVLKGDINVNNHARMKLFALGYDGSRKQELPLGTSGRGNLHINIDTGKLAHGPTPFFELVGD